MPKRHFFLSIVLTTLVISWPGVQVWCQSAGAPLVKAYPRQAYAGAGQIFGIAQDSRGVMYFASGSELIEFDGERWRSIPTGGAMLALASDSEDRLFLAGPNRVGYYAADALGVLQRHGLESKLPEEYRSFRDVWPVVVTEGGVMMAARDYLFRYHDDEMTVWTSTVEKMFYRIYELSGRVFIAQLGVGLLELTTDDQLVLVSDGTLDPLAEINAMYTLEDGSFLLITRVNGAFRLTDEGLERVSGSAVPWLRENQVQHGCRLTDGRLALGTRRGGVALINEQLDLLRVLDSSSGLSNESISFVFEDRQQNLWTGTDNGVNRVAFDAVLEGYGEQAGIPQMAVFSFASHRGELIVGTSLGVYRGLRDASDGGRLKFEAVSDVESQVWAAVSAEDSLLVATTNGFYEIRIRSGNRGLSLTTASVLHSATSLSMVRSSRDPDVVYVGTEYGLGHARRREGQWQWAGRIEGLKHEVLQLMEGDSGEILALMPALQQIAILSSPDNLESPPEIIYHDLGFGGGMSRVDGQLIYSGEGRYQRYEGWTSAVAGNAFVSEEKLASLGDAFIYQQDSEGRLWVSVDGKLRLATNTDRGFELKPVSHQFLEVPIEIYEDPDLVNAYWLGTVDGLVRLNPNEDNVERRPTQTLIRRVVKLADSAILDGGSARAGMARIEPTLDFAESGLRFEFSAPVFDQQSEMLYRVRLDGFGEDWTPWSSENFKEYSALSEGSYIFRVESQDARGVIGPQASFGFVVLPPWYRTNWAYLSYFFAAVSALLVVSRLRTRSLEQRTRSLEHDVRDRTRELADGMRQVEQQAKDLEQMNYLLAEENEHRRLLEIERSKLQTRMEQSQKLESLGLMAGGIAHDFNNILTAILGNADLCLDEEELPGALDRRLRAISEASQRAADLCQQMLAYAGKGQLEERELDLSMVTRETLELLQVSIDPKVQIETDLANHLPAFIGDSTKIRQLVMNLLSNGAEAMGEKRGVLRASTGERQLYAADLQKVVLADPIAEGPYVFLRVEDTGLGMDEETRRKIFDPFFTTKFAGRGLGLAAVLGILRSHGGAISVESQEGEGTTFEVFFPALDHSADDLAAPSSEEIRRWRATGTVLVVDDEDIVRDVLTLMLRNTGFEVLSASGGREAIEIFGAHHESIGAVILDLTMPGLDGLETFDELRRINPEIRVVLSSGYSGDTLIERYMERGFAAFVPKPFKVTTLRETLREVLD